MQRTWTQGLSALTALFAVIVGGCGADPRTVARPTSPPTPTPTESVAAPAPVDHVATARALVEHLAKMELEPVLDALSPELRKRIEPRVLASTWAMKKGGGGAFVKIDAAALKPAEDGEAVIVKVALTNGSIDVAVVFPFGKSEVTGLQIKDAVETPYVSAPYVDAAKFETREVSVGAGDHALPGVLTVPKGQGPFPIVVLVHGSGGGDRDEAIGPSKPFRDLAEGLATKGVATLRWDKRTHDPKYLAALHIDVLDFTVKEEYLDDVAAALEVAKTAKNVDPKRVFVLGHSEGGWLTPWLVKLHPEVKGGILLAGNARTFADLFVTQYTYLLTVDDGKLGPEDVAMIDELKKQVATAKDPKTPRDTPNASLPAGIGPAKYWQSLVGYDAVATAKGLSQPFLVLQGGRDYQVTEKDDYALWKAALGSKKGCETQLFPNLNHAFFAGTGMATPTEYELQKGYVDEPVLKAIVAFASKSTSSPGFGGR